MVDRPPCEVIYRDGEHDQSLELMCDHGGYDHSHYRFWHDECFVTIGGGGDFTKAVIALVRPTVLFRAIFRLRKGDQILVEDRRIDSR